MRRHAGALFRATCLYLTWNRSGLSFTGGREAQVGRTDTGAGLNAMQRRMVRIWAEGCAARDAGPRNTAALNLTARNWQRPMASRSTEETDRHLSDDRHRLL